VASGVSVEVRPSSTYEALAFHALAHLTLEAPRSLRDERYLAWSRASLPEAARWPLEADALALSRRIALDGAADAVQWLPLLHGSIDGLLATSQHELGSRALDAHAEPMALGALRARLGDGVEWLRADVLLVARAFAAAVDASLRVDPRSLDEVKGLLGAFAPADVPSRVVLDPSLGARGRAFPEVVFVGAPAPWNGLDARTPAVLALHEHAVRCATGSLEAREWSALVRVARRVGSTSALREAHAAWLAQAPLEPLLEAARVRGAITSSDVANILAAPDRSDAIASLSA
jgi:hypothetical protein